MDQTLTREVLRWIQSLDLAYSVKNVKRDFSNGFLVAEIYSRYYDKDVQMHSFDNGIALRIKKDNWSQLLKFFRKVGISEIITQAEVNQIIHCEDGAVIKFVNRMYETLTQRIVQKVSRRLLPDRSPAFARETSAAAIRTSLRGAVLAETSDEATRASRLAERIGLHERSLQEERSLEPDRYQLVRPSNGSSSADVSLLRAPTRIVGTGASAVAKVTVKAINVRQVDLSVAHLRGHHDENTMVSRAILSRTSTMDIPHSSSARAELPPPVHHGRIATSQIMAPVGTEGMASLDTTAAVGKAIPVTEAVTYCVRLVDQAATVAATQASATAADVHEQAASLTAAQIQQLREVGREYDAAGTQAAAVACELRDLEGKFTMAEASYRALKEPTSISKV